MDSILPSGSDWGVAFFATAIGECGIAWTGVAVTGVQLPARTPAGTRARLAKRVPAAPESAPPGFVRSAIDDIITLLDGGRTDLSGVPWDRRHVRELNRRVYEMARTTAPGST